jgi:uncharacterized protein YuzE
MVSKQRQVKFEYDRESDAAYLRIRPGRIVESEEIEPGLVVDLGPDDQIVAVEILRFAKRFAGKTKKLAS